MDALLGGAGLGDIGTHFPDTDPKYKGISSMLLLEEVRGSIESAGYKIGNIDSVIICQRPKLKPYIPLMKDRIASVLDIEISQINVKATTTEKLGFVGREEGIASEAIALIIK
jgi:2-C-methyl-D-erythritol 2,4-cyclodiphosphate synthase